MVKKCRKWISVAVILSLILGPQLSFALPQGENVVSGSADFDRSQANTLTVNVATDRLIANYNSFSIGQNEAVHFNQPSAASIALNRVVGIDPSSILGALTANGRIFLVNPNGILFGQGCRVDTAGMVASTLNLADSDFLAGRYTFYGPGGSVVNQGYISVPGGYVALLGSTVENAGVIEANLGSIALASGNQLTLNLDPQGTISVAIDEATVSNLENKDAAVKNSGTIMANGGKVILTAKTLSGVFKNAVNTEGIIEANAIGDVNGQVVLEANDRVNVGGTINAQGGNVTVNSEGANFSGSIKAAQGIYNMHDGDTVINPGGTFTGYQSWLDNGNITVAGDITVTDNGTIYIRADNDNSGSGDLNVNKNVTSQGGDIDLEGANVYVNSGVNVETISNSGSEGSDSNAIYLYAHGTAGASGYNGTVTMGSGSTVNAQVNGSGTTWVDIKGGDITLNSATVSAKSLGGDFDWASVEMIGGNSVNILNGSNVLAQTSSIMDGSMVYIQGKDITVDASNVTAEVNGNADGSAEIYLGHDPEDPFGEGDIETRNISILNGSTVRAEMANGKADTDALVEMDLTGTLDIQDSSVYAISGVSETDGLGSAYIDLNLYGEGAGNVNISGSTVSAEVDGEGQAQVNVYNSDKGMGDLASLADILGYTDTTGPINGAISLINSTINATAESTSSFDFNNLFNGSRNAVVGMMSSGPITLTNSTISAVETSFPALVGLLTDSYVSVDSDSAISATTGDSAAAVGILALGSDESGRSIDIAGTVSADAGNGAGIVGLLGTEDVSATGTVRATGSLDTLGLLTNLVAEYTDYSVDFGTGETIGSAALLASLNGDVTLGDISADLVGVAALGLEAAETGKGNIYDAGTVSGKILALLARHNIGTSSQPLNTDVDTVAGYSWDTGDIFLNEMNSIELGLYWPISINDGVSLRDIEFSLPLAANDGNIQVVSGGDMLINSVLAPNGSVYLQSTSGSIYGGQAWDPTALQDIADAIVGIAAGNGLDLGPIEVGSYTDALGLGNVFAEDVSLYAPNGNVELDGSTITAEKSGDGSASVSMYAQAISLLNGTNVTANVLGSGSANVNLQAYRYNGETGQYEGSIDVLGGSSILSSVGSGSATTQLYADDINVVGSTIKSRVRDNVDGGSAYLYLYPYNYYSNQDNTITIDSSVLEASTVGRGTAHIDLGRNDYYYYNYGNGSIDITNGSSLLASVGGGDARIWAWANDILVADSSLKALSTAGLDAAYSNAYIYLYAYDYNYYDNNTQDTHLTLDNASVIADVAGLGQAYIQLYSYNYNYYGYSYGDSYMDILGSSLLANVGAGYAYNYAYSSGPLNIMDSSVIARSQAQDTTAGVEGQSYNNYAQNYIYSYDNNYYSYEDTDNDLTITNSDILSEVLGDGYAQTYIYTYDYYNSYGDSNSSLFLNDSSVRSAVSGTGSAYVYLQAYDYYSNNNSALQLNNSQVSSFVGSGDSYSRVYLYGDSIDLVNSDIAATNNGTGWEEAYLYAQNGSILSDAGSLITADWVDLNAINHIGTLESPVNTDTSNLLAHSFGSPVWVSDESEGGGSYLYGDGNIYVNNVGTGLLNVGPPDQEGGDTVQTNNGVVSVTTLGDMVVHYVIAPVGGVFLKSQNGSIYAGERPEGNPNVIAGGASYFSTPNGTIGVGTPDSKDLAASGGIQGIVDPGVVAVTGVDPSPDIDLRFGPPPGYVLFENTESEDGVQQIWPEAPAGVATPDNPLKVAIQIVEGGLSALPEGFSTTAALTLQINNIPPVVPLVGNGLEASLQMANALKNFRAYYEILNGYRLQSFEPATPTQFYAYHPLTETDMSAFDEMDMDVRAFDFIDNNIQRKKALAPYLGVQ